MRMLEHKEPLNLAFLNEATQEWAELGYNKRIHREIGSTPLDRDVNDPGASRSCLDMESLRLEFCTWEE
ncbi:hypothetical protein JXA40_11885 [bacterium]|nr:hypothetical protein [candidate division CSSED10-310 bacterium]